MRLWENLGTKKIKLEFCRNKSRKKEEEKEKNISPFQTN